MASTSLPSLATTALPAALSPLPPLLPPPPTPRCRRQRRVSAALPNALPILPKSRFYQAAASAAKLAAAAAAAATAALPLPHCCCLRCRRAAAASNTALSPSCRRRYQADVVFRKEWYRKTGKEVMEGHPLLHRQLGFKYRCKGCLKLIIMMLF